MKINLTIASALALALAACGSQEDPAEPVADDTTAAAEPAAEMPDPSTPQGFVDMAASSDMYEIEAGKLAQEQGKSQAVKDFGAMMVKDHTASTDKLKAAGAKASPAITPNPVLTAEQEANLSALRAADGAAFDAAYKTQQVAAHEKALALVKDYAASGDVPELKKFASDAEKIVQAHLTKIKGL